MGGCPLGFPLKPNMGVPSKKATRSSRLALLGGDFLAATASIEVANMASGACNRWSRVGEDMAVLHFEGTLFGGLD